MFCEAKRYNLSKNFWQKIDKPILALAPMAGYTDSAFRQIIKKLAKSTVLFTELISSDGLSYKSANTLEYLQFTKKEHPIIIQLFGKKPASFIHAVKIVETFKPDGIDINMGCPARKVIGSFHGSALLQDPDLAAEIVYNTVKSTSLPVSVKTRIGFKNYDEKFFLNFCQKIESAGASCLTIHGRTTAQGFGGKAVFEPIYAAKKILKIPVIGNGDITSSAIALDRLKNLDGIMVGRATFGNPWLMAEIEAALHHKKLPAVPSFIKKIPLIIAHAKLAFESKKRKGILEMRKHLAVYVKGLPNISKYRTDLVQVESISDIKKILTAIAKNSD